MIIFMDKNQREINSEMKFATLRKEMMMKQVEFMVFFLK